jgi:hypothetical protein
MSGTWEPLIDNREPHHPAELHFLGGSPGLLRKITKKEGRGEEEERKRRGRGEEEERKRRGRGEEEERKRGVYIPLLHHSPLLSMHLPHMRLITSEQRRTHSPMRSSVQSFGISILCKVQHIKKLFEKTHTHDRCKWSFDAQETLRARNMYVKAFVLKHNGRGTP